MQTGLHAVLGSEEEIILRRIAHDSLNIKAHQVQRLLVLALVERVGREFRLTALGRRRFEALPKPPLSKRSPPNLLRAVLERIIDKAPAASAPSPETPEVPVSSDPEWAEPEHLHPVDSSEFHRRLWMTHAQRRLETSRRNLLDHRRVQVALLDSSLARIVASRTNLMATAPRRPTWLTQPDMPAHKAS